MRRWVVLVVGWTVLIASPSWACYWDHDTLMMERRRFPSALELITGKFLRHSAAYYQWRIDDRLEKLKADPKNLRFLDDLAVAYDKLGQHDKAIETILKKNAIQPGLYETEANLGTFLIHAGRLEEGLEHIRRAIEINPEAHFGREIYQQLLVEYVLSKRNEDRSLPMPLEGSSNRTDHFDPAGFARFVLEQRQIDEDNGRDVEKELGRAIKGVLGMMRFGNYDSPVLLEALGDLLLSYGRVDDGKRLAARAFLKASYEVSDPHAQEEYRKLAEQALQRQTVHELTYRELSLRRLEKVFQRELEEAKAWYEQVAADERRWIDEGVDVDAAFAKKYYTEPTVEYRDPAAVRATTFKRLLPVGVVLAILLVVLALAASGYGLYRLQRWYASRRGVRAEGESPQPSVR